MFFPKASGPKGWLVVLASILILALFLVSTPAEIAWATPPQQGTVPPSPEEEEEEGPPPPPDLTLVEKVPWTVGPNGGQLDLKYGVDGCLLINVQPGMLGEEILFEVAAKSADQAPPDTCTCSSTEPMGLCKTGTVYTVDGWYRQRGQPVGNDRLPGEYVHTICYSDADLALAGGDPHNLVIAFYDDALGAWQSIPTSVDTINHNVSGLTNHLSWWALMARKPCTPTIMPVTGGTKTGEGELLAALWLALLLIGLGLWVLMRCIGQWRRTR